MMLRGFRRKVADLASARFSERFQVGNASSIDNWTKSISAKATTPEGKMYAGQLSSVMSFFNKDPDSNDAHEVNWEEWSSRINTKGLVDKIRKNTEALMEEKYNVASVAGRVTSEPTEDYKKISSELQYHYALWDNYYKQNVELLVQLEGIGNLSTYLPEDMADLFYGFEPEVQRLEETMHYIPGATDDVNTYGYLDNQFQWGKSVITFYKHPTDDFKCVIGTKNIIGR